MNLYLEVPKETLISELRNKFKPEDFELVKNDLYGLSDACHTLDELYRKVYEILKSRTSLRDYKITRQDNFIGI